MTRSVPITNYPLQRTSPHEVNFCHTVQSDWVSWAQSYLGWPKHVLPVSTNIRCLSSGKGQTWWCIRHVDIFGISFIEQHTSPKQFVGLGKWLLVICHKKLLLQLLNRWFGSLILLGNTFQKTIFTSVGKPIILMICCPRNNLQQLIMVSQITSSSVQHSGIKLYDIIYSYLHELKF